MTFMAVRELLSIGRKRLSLHPIDKPGWALIWTGIINNLGREDDGLINIGCAWMKINYEGRSVLTTCLEVSVGF